MFTDRSIQVKPVGPRAPSLSAFVERWIPSLKHEALDPIMVIGLDHFEYIVHEYVAYYHENRPHQGIGNTLIGDEKLEGPPVKNLRDIECESRLVGVLKHYQHAAEFSRRPRTRPILAATSRERSGNWKSCRAIYAQSLPASVNSSPDFVMFSRVSASDAVGPRFGN